MNFSLKKIFNLLSQKYSSSIALNYKTPFELLLAVILSAQCTDKKVNAVTKNLFKKYRRLEDYINAKTEEFAKDIKPTGFYQNKAKNILQSAKIIKTKYGGKIPSSISELTKLPGVGRKTANVVLATLYQKTEGIVVDTHVKRISQRLRLVNLNNISGKQANVFVKNGKQVIDYKKDASPEKIEQELMRVVPKKYWSALPNLLIRLGKDVCKAGKPICQQCIINQNCPVSRV